MSAESVPRTRKEARAKGETRYYTGRPCINGHVAERMVANGTCVTCLRATNNEWIRLNPEKLKLGDKRRTSRYRLRNAVAIKERIALWHKANPERSKAIAKKSRKTNAETLRCLVRNRRAKIKHSPGTHTRKDIQALFEAQKSLCANCRSPFVNKGYHVDHIEPVAKGGSNGPANLQLLCRKCNQSKSDLDPYEWAQRNGRLF